MLLIAVFFKKISSLFEGFLGRILVALLSTTSCMPALLNTLGFQVDYWICISVWALSAFFSSVIFLQTGLFFIWLHRQKLARCLALSLLIASIFYIAATWLEATVGVIFVMCMPIVSCVCSYLSKVNMDKMRRKKKENAIKRQEEQCFVGSFKTYAREVFNFAPTDLIYATSFGCVSCIALLFASKNSTISVIAFAIFIASVVATLLAFPLNKDFDAGRLRKVLLPLIAVSILPFPYLNNFLRIPFLAIAIFVFVFFDAITWGDLADEVRDRNVHRIGYSATLTFVNFFGVAIGWSAGYAMIKLMPFYPIETMFGIVSIVFVTALIVDLVFDSKMNTMGGDVVSPIVDENDNQNKEEEAIEIIAKEYKLSKREHVIAEMLARGRNYKYIENKLVISGHTVKTHVYHIYKKLDIHSQQDLLDMVEDIAQGK